MSNEGLVCKRCGGAVTRPITLRDTPATRHYTCDCEGTVAVDIIPLTRLPLPWTAAPRQKEST